MGQAPELIEALLSADPYPHPVGPIQLIETHISWVLLTGEFAYKIKKPVELGFVDFSSLAKRRDACELEVALNRRLAGDLYLGVVAIAGAAETPRIAGSGPVMEYAVKMRQFVPDDTLDHLIETTDLQPALLESFAARLAEFHSRLPGAAADAEYGRAAKIAAEAGANLDQLAATAFGQANGLTLAALRRWSAAQAEALAGFMTTRKTAGFVRECHGDLHLGNLVVLEGQCVAFDCLEFSAELRFVDTIDEVAFLVMDLLAHRRPDLAFTFLNRYLELTGDYAGLQALRFYLVYRALVRSKVWALTGPPSSARSAANPQGRARLYLELAQELAHGARPRLLLTHGLSGSGKSWLSERLCRRLPALRIRTDIERKRLLNLPAAARSGAAPAQGPYTSAVTQAVYQRCGQLARAPLADGWTVILDAAALQRWQRTLAARVAADMQARFCIVHCQAQPDALRKRLKHRQRANADPSEADLEVLAYQLQHAEPLSPDEELRAVPVATDQPLDWPRLLAAIERATA